MVENIYCQDMVEKVSAGSQASPTGSRTGFRSPTRRGRFAGAAGCGCPRASPVVAGAGESSGAAPAGTSAFFHIPSDLVVDSCPHMLRAAQPLISRGYTTRGRKTSHKIKPTISIGCDFTTKSGGVWGG